MDELMMSTGFWVVAMFFSFCTLAIILIVAAMQWLRWTLVRIEGAGRKVFVGLHSRTGDGFVYPRPEEQEMPSFFISPLGL